MSTGRGHLDAIHESERLVDSLIATRDELRGRAEGLLREGAPQWVWWLVPLVMVAAAAAVAPHPDQFGGQAIAVAAVATLLVAVATVRSTIPETETANVRALACGETAAALADNGADAGAGDTHLGVIESLRRVLLVPTVRRLLGASIAAGVMVAPLAAFTTYYLHRRWHEGVAPAVVFGAVALAIAAWIGPKAHHAVDACRHAAVALVTAVACVALATMSRWAGPMWVLLAAGFVATAVALPLIVVVQLAVVPAAMRRHAGIVTALCGLGVGTIVGVAYLSAINRRDGAGSALGALLVPGLIGAAILWSAVRLVPSDVDRMVDDLLEDEEIRLVTSAGGHLPMLACRGVDFSYGKLQVLFDVDFTVDDGEMVALLGTNGAGKSTLLKCISGVGLPSGGTVRFRGGDITFLDAERRIPLGITQVPGGRAVFGPMTVVENLRAYGHTVRRERRALATAIDTCFVTFPRLAERRNQPASTLSGGEQQMLGLAKALILRPQLLLIDELSLGLAPIIVGQLLELVREINATGTAVVLVEQSVNIALGLVDHAYFMEKGEVRFDGRSDELLARGDLLRAVFLEGAASARETTPRA